MKEYKQVPKLPEGLLDNLKLISAECNVVTKCCCLKNATSTMAFIEPFIQSDSILSFTQTCPKYATSINNNH